MATTLELRQNQPHKDLGEAGGPQRASGGRGSTTGDRPRARPRALCVLREAMWLEHPEKEKEQIRGGWRSPQKPHHEGMQAMVKS